MPIPTTNLYYDLKAGVGVTSSGGLVSSWTPQGGSLTDPATQGTDANKPFDTVDDQGNPCVVFDATSANAFLNVPAGFIVNTGAYSVWVVAAATHFTNSSFLNATGWNAELLGLLQPSSGASPLVLTSSIRNGSVYVRNNKSLLGAVSGVSAIVTHNNNDSDTLAVTPFATDTSGGGIIGKDVNGSGLYGFVYRIVVYKGIQSPTDIAATKAALIAEHSVTTSYPNRLVMKGDSETFGKAQTQSRNVTYRLSPAFKAKWEIFNLGSSGETALSMLGDVPTEITPLFNGSQSCEAILWAGINDLALGADTPTTFSRLTAVCAAIKSGDAWNKVHLCCLPANGGHDVLPLNTLIRGGDVSYDDFTDIGTPTVPQLSNAADLTYFDADQTHQNDAGGQIEADIISASLAPAPSSTTLLPCFLGRFGMFSGILSSVAVAVSLYFRPDGTSKYLRPDGTSLYQRP